MTSHFLAKRLLELPDTIVQAWDPDEDDWHEITGFTSGEDSIELYTDEVDE